MSKERQDMFRRLLLAVLLLVIGAGLLGYAALTLPGFESWLQKQAEKILSEYLERLRAKPKR